MVLRDGSKGTRASLIDVGTCDTLGLAQRRADGPGAGANTAATTSTTLLALTYAISHTETPWRIELAWYNPSNLRRRPQTQPRHPTIHHLRHNATLPLPPPTSRNHPPPPNPYSHHLTNTSQTFLRIIPLRTATEFILFTLAINKITGLYGILALFTGYHLNPLQLSHYIYSLVTLGLIAYLHPAIRERGGSPLKNVALAWLYIADMVVSSVYTSLFGAGWFLLLAEHMGEDVGAGKGLGVGTMNETAGFTSPSMEGVGSVSVVATGPASGALAGQEAIAFASSSSPSSATGVFLQPGSMASLIILAVLSLVRLYFCVIVLSHARMALRQHIASTSSSYSTAADPTMADGPFRGEPGWQGQMGRAMLRFPTRRYWLGRDEGEEEWVRQARGRFEMGALKVKVPAGADVAPLGERERRARSGTGPPPPPLQVLKGKLPQ